MTTESERDDNIKHKASESSKVADIIRHHLSFHSPNSIACDYCPKTFKRKVSLRRHLYYHFSSIAYKRN